MVNAWVLFKFRIGVFFATWLSEPIPSGATINSEPEIFALNLNLDYDSSDIVGLEQINLYIYKYS